MIEVDSFRNKLCLLVENYKKLNVEVDLKKQELEQCKLDSRKIDSERAECYNKSLVKQAELEDCKFRIDESETRIIENEKSSQDCQKATADIHEKIQKKDAFMDELELKLKDAKSKSDVTAADYTQLVDNLRDAQLKLEKAEQHEGTSESIIMELDLEQNFLNKKLSKMLSLENDAEKRRTDLQNRIDVQIERLNSLNKDTNEAEEVIEQLNLELSLLQEQAIELTESSRKSQAQLDIMRASLQEA